ncbi:MAG: GYD domain-containing protein [Dehalococcoidia bacterium]|nr:GYD domain-containing protein [Dehalococcoidia bacterium]
MKEFYAVMGMGQYDTMFILEAPDDEAVGKAALTIGSQGNVHTNSFRAFTEDEYKRMIAALP